MSRFLGGVAGLGPPKPESLDEQEGVADQHPRSGRDVHRPRFRGIGREQREAQHDLDGAEGEAPKVQRRPVRR